MMQRCCGWSWEQRYEAVPCPSDIDAETTEASSRSGVDGALSARVAHAEADPAEVDEELKEHGGPYDRKIAVGQVTIRLPLDPDPRNLLALLYGFLPWIVPLAFVLDAAIERHFMSIYAVCITLFVTVLNEGILKPILKQPRPKQTANRYADGRIKPGMPSGHVFNAGSLMVWATLEVAVRGPGYEEDRRKLTAGWLALVLALMLPVPWARWYNLDHTAAQCGVSIFLGIVVGIAAFYVRTHYFRDHWKYWDPMMDTTAANS
jgi:hypothetical protein